MRSLPLISENSSDSEIFLSKVLLSVLCPIRFRSHPGGRIGSDDDASDSDHLSGDGVEILLIEMDVVLAPSGESPALGLLDEQIQQLSMMLLEESIPNELRDAADFVNPALLYVVLHLSRELRGRNGVVLRVSREWERVDLRNAVFPDDAESILEIGILLLGESHDEIGSDADRETVFP